jgi:hypothetical protein
VVQYRGVLIGVPGWSWNSPPLKVFLSASSKTVLRSRGFGLKIYYSIRQGDKIQIKATYHILTPTCSCFWTTSDEPVQSIGLARVPIQLQYLMTSQGSTYLVFVYVLCLFLPCIRSSANPFNSMKLITRYQNQESFCLRTGIRCWLHPAYWKSALVGFGVAI